MVNIPDLQFARTQKELPRMVQTTNIFSGLAQATEGLAQGLDLAQKRREEKQRRETDSFMNDHMYDFAIDAETMFGEMKQSHENIDTFAEEYDKRFKERAMELSRLAGENIDQDRVKGKLAQIRAGVMSKAIDFQSEEKLKSYEASTNNAIQGITKHALITGDWKQAELDLDEAIKNSESYTTPSQQTAMRQKARNVFAMSKIESAIESNPDVVDDLIESNQKDLNIDDIPALRKRAEQATKAIEGQYEKDLKNRQDKNRFDVFMALSDNLTNYSDNEIVSMVNNNSLDPDDAEALIKFKNTDEAKEDTLEGIAEVNDLKSRGVLSQSRIIELASNGQITKKTAIAQLNQIGATFTSLPIYKQGIQFIEANYDRNFMGAILPEHQADLADDTQEFYDRVQQRETAEPGKSIKDIAIDIADRRAGNERVRKERQLAINQYKKENDIRTKEDAQERIEDVLEAFEEGRLSQEEADSQIIILEQLEGLLK